MKKLFLTLAFLSLFSLPAFAFADSGHAEGAPHGNAIQQSGSVHIHEDGTVESHSTTGGFALATPWSSTWWMLLGISLILMGVLSIQVQKYLQVQ